MEKTFWGPSTWCMIHCAAAAYKPEYKSSFNNFRMSLPFLLPCESCRKHLMANFEKNPLTERDLMSRENLFMWTYFLHDLVNKDLHKKSSSFDLVSGYYKQHLTHNNFWGPCFWRTIHSFAASFKPDPFTKHAFKQFIYSLDGILPTAASQQNFRALLVKIPLREDDLKSAEALFLWSFLFHNAFNQLLGKYTPSFESVRAEYFNKQTCASCGMGA